MKSFTLILTATFDFRDDEFNDIGFKWSSIDGKALLDAPRELDFTIYKLMKDCTYALPILSHFFKEFSQEKQPVMATASVQFEGENEDWQLAFSALEKNEVNEYIQGLLFGLLTQRNELLRKVKLLEKELY
ncbi:hypothetical protein [Histophilus somni]|uniref:Uncharacterized protein n=1 Tax=Histophilus somni TaxID=731 RepID=A0AAX2S2Y7_HISSO|nr:hypothetical protein [Histophilus somni]ACA32312.1 hypothetical protein HSM_0654 [Histophilus somni 2336]TDF40551.1 hypothetical protein E1290_05150 [Histophilus somni]TEW28971.1 hypothetical protein E2R48_07785 [Histophilus somni]TFF01096.1 hypothetical protein E3U35_07760 [Histophilus somni]THA91321.1 hypothetical protein E6A58_07670 [Histophilus somni]